MSTDRHAQAEGHRSDTLFFDVLPLAWSGPFSDGFGEESHEFAIANKG